MELKAEHLINAPRERVYAALNDPDILRQCIPGCQSLEKTDETHYDAVVSLKVGPVKATFNGAVELTDLAPPTNYAIVGEGKSGAAGFAKGRADVVLTEIDGGGTNLAYVARADVGGKLAQLGSRLLDSTAKKLAGEFFTRFQEAVEAAGTPAPSPAVEPASAAEPDATPAEPAPAASIDPVEAAVAPAAAGAMLDAGPQAPAPAPTAFGGDRSSVPGDSGSGFPWRWVAAAIAAVIIIALLLGYY